MTLGEKQELFARMQMLLMLHLHTIGYSMRGGHWMRCNDCRVGKKYSNHKLKLAFDINLSLAPSHDERPRFLTGQAAINAHNKLHDYWDTLGGAPRIKRDLNHYSIVHNGRW